MTNSFQISEGLDADAEAVERAGVGDAPLDEIQVAPLVDEGAGGEDVFGIASDVPVAAQLMDRDKFFEFFSGAFIFTGNLYAFKAPLHLPLQSLTRAAAFPTARPASDEIHALAMRYDWLHWLLEEDNNTVKALIVIGAFGAQVAQSLAAETRQHRELIAAREAETTQAQEQGQGIDEALGVMQ